MKAGTVSIRMMGVLLTANNVIPSDFNVSWGLALLSMCFFLYRPFVILYQVFMD